jgi:antitoxin (DNA-binding transcriptional repressor) of toxin-antitoxin stability system
MRELLSKTMNLAGQTETITAMDFRKTPGDVLLQAQMGKTFLITKNGVVVAKLSAPESNALELGAAIRRLGLTGDRKRSERKTGGAK